MATQKKRKKGNPAAFSADYRRGTENPVQDRDDTELDDFLPEGETLPAGDEALEKHGGCPWPAAGGTGSSCGSARCRARPRRRGRRRYGIALGAAVLLLALVGVVAWRGCSARRSTAAPRTTPPCAPTTRSWPASSCSTPEPFESIESADPLFVQNAALWKSILEEARRVDRLRRQRPGSSSRWAWWPPPRRSSSGRTAC